MRRTSDVATIGLFAVLLLAPTLDRVFGLDPVPRRREMRSVASWDEVREAAAQPAALPGALRRWVGDHFGFRNALIRGYARLAVEGLGVSSSEQVMLGREGWLFLGTEHAVASARALSPLRREEVAQVAVAFQTRSARLEQAGARYLLAIVPDKHSVYRQHLPAGMTQVGARTRLDRLERVLVRVPGLTFVPLREPLLALSAQLESYDRIGTHWNACAALMAHGRLMEPIRAWFPEAVVRLPDDYTPRWGAGGDVDLARLLGLEGVLESRTCEAMPRFVPRAVQAVSRRPFAENPMGEGGKIWQSRVEGLPGPRVLLVQDSFGNALRPFLAESFPEATFFVSDTVLTATDADALIERLQPDVVLHVFAERRLEYLLERDRERWSSPTPPGSS